MAVQNSGLNSNNTNTTDILVLSPDVRKPVIQCSDGFFNSFLLTM